EEGQPMGTFYTYMPQYVTDKSSPYYGSPIVGSDGQPVLGTTAENTGYNMNHLWTGGVNTTLNYKGIQLSATLDVRYGGKMFSRTKNLMQFCGNGIETIYNNRKPFVIPGSVQETDDGYVENNVPIYLKDSSYQDYFDAYGWGQGGMSYLVDRSYAKLRNITLGYSLPKKWTNAIFLSQVTLSLFVNNVFTWTAADNYYVDPELTTTGSDLAGQFGELYTNPACRVYGFNVNLKF
ncbi:MAG: SusC/RagA family TonB-linked outer membrane protein, partial [Bacteroidales bacterium]|nr:SusC/RagA family TonB-linked outer membrane protein [Bacteroidales bacterium]